ncbi:MAG: hypothetical protein GEU95_23885 [Rhizobiales bacterium]|nr:hypothetical protein [Hyphomicrobiales bacterium]
MSATIGTTAKRRLARRRTELFGATALLMLLLTAGPSLAQGLQPGEAFATRFSGTVPAPDGSPSIDPQGTVGSILDLRAPGQPAQGQHWANEPQRAPVTAAQTGQVFGVAFDDATPPNIYVTATATFGLHRTADNSAWMPGMFGEGGPGAIYKLDAASGYQPQLLTTITLNGRPNSGAALGNIAFDRWNRQLLVSDLETGMIHRVSLDGHDLGSYDHGTQGRTSFVDAATGQPQSLAPIAFNPASQARIADCDGKFDITPTCWNVAESNRRVWGLGVWKGPNGETRLYYSVASSPDLGGNWASLPEDEKRNTLWSVRLGPDGSFDVSGVRREFALPDFFANPQDIARAGYSRPVSDITFPACSGRPVMLVAERGGLRNLGLGEENAFATPHEARTIRYEFDQTGTWRAMGRYDVGMYDRSKEGAPYINANCAGGATFGPGYSADGQASGPADGFVWMSGDTLCSPDGPCNAAPGQGQVQQVSAGGQGDGGYQPDESEVHGVQGQPEDMYNALVPDTANNQNQATPANPIGPDQAYMVDIDINVDPSGTMTGEDNTRNDATMIGDISVYQICAVASAAYATSYPLMAVPVGIIHGRGVSHYRAGSHARFFSHWRWGSHSRWASHDRRWSTGHYRWWSDGHWRRLSPSHRRHMSPTHWRHRSPGHWRGLSPSHRRHMSPTHHRHMSPTHHRLLSPTHRRGLSPTHHRGLSPVHKRGLSPVHKRGLSPTHHRGLSPTHQRGLSPVHKRPLSPTHSTLLSPGHNRHLSPIHKRRLSPTHSSKLSPGHNRPLSPPQHVKPMSPGRPIPGTTTHLRVLSKNKQPQNDRPALHTRYHSRKVYPPKHAARVSHQRTLSPKIGIKGKRKAITPKRHIGGGMGGGRARPSGGMGMGGMGAGGMPKRLNRSVAPRPTNIGRPQRIGPQMFRGGNGPYRR